MYKTTEEWQKVSEIIKECFLAKSGLYHYLSTAKGNYREFLKGDIVKLKKYFYVLRPLLACRWILGEKTPPPMLFSELVDSYLDASIKPAVEDLVRLKMQTPEIGEGKRIDILNDYIDRSIEEIEDAVKALPEEKKQGWDRLDSIFHEIVID